MAEPQRIGDPKGVRLRFWLAVMDLIAWAGGFGSRAYLFAVERAGAATWPGQVRGVATDTKGLRK